MKSSSLRRRAYAHAIFALAILTATHTAHAAITTFSDGAVHNISSASEQLNILDGPGSAPTTVNVQTGAVVAGPTPDGDFSVNARENTIFTMSGGLLQDELFLFNNSTANITGGTVHDDVTTSGTSHADIHNVIVDDDLEANTNSVMNVFGGSFDEDVESSNFATINLHGGNFQTGTDGADVQSADNSVINIHGGTFGFGQNDGAGRIDATEDSVINIHGGDFSKQPEGFRATGNGVINIYDLEGQPTSLNTSGNGVINVRDGGLVNLTLASGKASLFGTDGSLNNINAQGTSVITIYGANFKGFNGVVSLPYGAIAQGSGNLSGTLADGSVITNIPFLRNFVGTPAQIILAAPPVPEPSSIALLLGAITATAAAWRRRR